MIQDPSVLFVVIRTRNASATQRALEVSLGVKRFVEQSLNSLTGFHRSCSSRFRHREGMGDLNQYVIEEDPFKAPSAASSAAGSRPAPPIIKLDDPAPSVSHAVLHRCIQC